MRGRCLALCERLAFFFYPYNQTGTVMQVFVRSAPEWLKSRTAEMEVHGHEQDYHTAPHCACLSSVGMLCGVRVVTFNCMFYKLLRLKPEPQHPNPLLLNQSVIPSTPFSSWQEVPHSTTHVIGLTLQLDPALWTLQAKTHSQTLIIFGCAVCFRVPGCSYVDVTHTMLRRPRLP